jgi:hypothetical protein
VVSKAAVSVKMSNTDLKLVDVVKSVGDQYCSITVVMKLIFQPFDGNRRKLKECIDNVTTTLGLVIPEEHGILLKFVYTKISGDAKSELLVPDLTSA